MFPGMPCTVVVLLGLAPGGAGQPPPDEAAEREDGSRVLFEDRFEGRLAEGWRWLRERPAQWCVREGGLEIRVVPGKANTVKNALLRDAPEAGAYAVEVSVENDPSGQYEQGGITWYHDGKPAVKLVKEHVDGEVWVVLAGAGFFAKKPLETERVRLRFEVRGDRFRGLFRPHGDDAWHEAGGKELPRGDDDRISLQCYDGPPDLEHWVRFERFRIVALDD